MNIMLPPAVLACLRMKARGLGILAWFILPLMSTSQAFGCSNTHYKFIWRTAQLGDTVTEFDTNQVISQFGGVDAAIRGTAEQIRAIENNGGGQGPSAEAYRNFQALKRELEACAGASSSASSGGSSSQAGEIGSSASQIMQGAINGSNSTTRGVGAAKILGGAIGILQSVQQANQEEENRRKAEEDYQYEQEMLRRKAEHERKEQIEKTKQANLLDRAFSVKKLASSSSDSNVSDDDSHVKNYNMTRSKKINIPLDPDENHDGQPCAFFTKPSVREDGGGLNYYADDTVVVYGEWTYVCEKRRWRKWGAKDMLTNWQSRTAEKLEH
ncbi:MAG: hypothetical protein PHT19_13000 [Methylococcus sp.]|nr:hypothetical protein [Methylococcus sp.]